jgi:DNA polymerase type B, organellar and viral
MPNENISKTKAGFKKNFISKRKKEDTQRVYRFGAFDFETTSLDGDVCFGTAQYEKEIDGQRSEIFMCYSAAEMLDYLFENTSGKMRWYAHNLEYDLLFLLQEANKRLDWGELDKVELCERGMGSFYRAVFYRGEDKIELYDSMALFSFKLEYFTEQFSKVGKKLKLDFEKESFDINNPAHIEYAIQDTRALLDSMINFDAAIYQIFGVHAKGTISSTALAAWEVTLDSEARYYQLTKPQNDFCREAYFGGLVFLTDTNTHADCVSVDINSSYPDKMRRFGVPVGRPEYTLTIVWNRPGLYRCKFTAPDGLKFGCIGYRDKLGICWPRGEFESVAFEFEIKRALSWGYKVEMIEGIIFERYDYPFNDFVDLCERQRAKYKGTAFEIVVKLGQNSVYGKFGTGEVGKEICMFSELELENLDLAEWRPYIDDRSGSYPIDNCFERETEREAYYILPHWAAHITARAREQLFQMYEATGFTAIYGDTDSVKMTRDTYNKLVSDNKINVGKSYGEWKLDAEYFEFKAIAPKVYTYYERETIWPSLFKSQIVKNFDGKGKGIPEKNRTKVFWESVFYGATPTVEFNSLGGLSAALKKGGDRKLKPTHRASTNLKNSAGWFENDGEVKAVKIIDKKRIK